MENTTILFILFGITIVYLIVDWLKERRKPEEERYLTWDELIEKSKAEAEEDIRKAKEEEERKQKQIIKEAIKEALTEMGKEA